MPSYVYKKYSITAQPSQPAGAERLLISLIHKFIIFEAALDRNRSLKFLKEQLCRAVACFVIVEVFIEAAVTVGDAEGKGFRRKQVFCISGGNADSFAHGDKEQRCGEVVHLNAGYLTPGGFLDEHPVLRIGAKQLVGIGNNDGLTG